MGERDGKADLRAHAYGRAALERMIRVHRLIEDGEYPNCTKMSGEFEMSVRTLKRDIEFMMDIGQPGRGSFDSAVRAGRGGVGVIRAFDSGSAGASRGAFLV